MAKSTKVTLKITMTDASTQDVSFVVPGGADGSPGATGETGPQGETGPTGQTGVGIASITVTQQDVDSGLLM